MAAPTSRRRILVYESFGFGFILLALWLNELLDLPHRAFGSVQTPINGAELAIESAIVVPFALLVIVSTARLLGRVRQLEGQLPVCAFCRKVRDGDRWVTLEEYVQSHSRAELADGLCRECLMEHFTGGPSPG